MPAAILITDLRGFTALSHSRSAEELIGLLGEYQSRLVPIIQRHGGSIDKYLADGILASFRAPSASYAADLSRGIDELAAATWRREIHIREPRSASERKAAATLCQSISTLRCRC